MLWQKLTGRQRHAGRAAAAVVRVVVAHWRPLIQWCEVPLNPSQSPHSPLFFPPLYPFSSVPLSPQAVDRGSHSLTHANTHSHTHTVAELRTPQRQSPRRQNIPIVPLQFSSLAFSFILFAFI